MEHNELKKQNTELWNEYSQIERNTLMQTLAGIDSIDEKILKANYYVNKSFQDFFNSDKYKEMKNNLDEYRKKCIDSESEIYDVTIVPFDDQESHFRIYVDEKDVCYPVTTTTDKNNDYAMVPIGNDEDMFINISQLYPSFELKGADMIKIGYNDMIDIRNHTFDGADKKLSGQELYDNMIPYLKENMILNRLPKEYRERHNDAIEYLECVHAKDETTRADNYKTYMEEIQAVEESGILGRIRTSIDISKENLSSYDNDEYRGIIKIYNNLYQPGGTDRLIEEVIIEDGDKKLTCNTYDEAINYLSNQIRNDYASERTRRDYPKIDDDNLQKIVNKFKTSRGDLAEANLHIEDEQSEEKTKSPAD